MSSTYTYPTISTVTVNTRAKGDSDTATLRSMFPTTPELVSGDLPSADSAAYKEAALTLLLDGSVEENPQVGSFSRDYAEAPDYDKVETGGGGLPASAWVPNPVSPGEGSVDPVAQAAPPEGFGQTVTNGSHSGKSTDVKQPDKNPSISSSKMSSREALELGKSSATVG